MAQYGVVAEASKSIWDFDPRIIPGCTLWMDAADSNTLTLSGGTAITQWRDKSSSGAVFALVSTSPNTSTINGYRSVLIANAANGTIVTTDQSLLSAGTVAYLTSPGQFAGFIVATYNSSSVNNVISDFGNAANFNVGTFNQYNVTINSSITASGQYYGALSSSRVMLGFTYDPTLASGSRVATYYSGTAGGTGGTGTATAYTNRLRLNGPIGTINGNQNLHFHEILLYSASLSTTERQQIEGYLAWKWGIQGGGTAPVVSLPTAHPYSSTTSIVRPFLRAFQPTDLPTPCMLWFDGADATTLTLSGSNVTAWRDKSGNANNINSFSATQPVYNSATGLLTFTNGTGTTANNISLSSTTSYSIFYAISFPAGLTDNNAFVYARSFQLTGTPLFFFGVGRGTYAVNVSGATISGSNTTYNMTNTSGLTTGNTVTIAGITLGSATGYNGTGVVQSFVTNTSITINITSTGTPTSFSGATARNGTSNVSYYSEGNAGGGPYFFFATSQGFNTYSGSTFIASMTQSGATAYTLSVNGNASAQTAATSTMANRQAVIGTGSGNAYGLGEVLVYNGALTAQDRRRVEGYLIWKWQAQRTSNPGASTNMPIAHPFYRFPNATTTP